MKRKFLSIIISAIMLIGSFSSTATFANDIDYSEIYLDFANGSGLKYDVNGLILLDLNRDNIPEMLTFQRLTACYDQNGNTLYASDEGYDNPAYKDHYYILKSAYYINDGRLVENSPWKYENYSKMVTMPFLPYEDETNTEEFCTVVNHKFYDMDCLAMYEISDRGKHFNMLWFNEKEGFNISGGSFDEEFFTLHPETDIPVASICFYIDETEHNTYPRKEAMRLVLDAYASKLNNNIVDEKPVEDEPVSAGTSISIYSPYEQYTNINGEIINMLNKDFLELRLKYGDVESHYAYNGANVYSFKNHDIQICCYDVVGGKDGNGGKYLSIDENFLLPDPLDACCQVWCTVNDLIKGLENRTYTLEELSAHTGIKFKSEYNEMDEIDLAVTNINGLDITIYLDAPNIITKDCGIDVTADWAHHDGDLIWVSKSIDVSNCTQDGIFYYLGDTLAKIDDSASGTVVIPNKIGNQKITRIASEALANNTNITEVIIEDGIQIIGKSTFYNMTNLRRVSMPHSLRVIDVCAFAGCTSLTDADIPTGVVQIGNGAFEDCKSLKFARIPVSVKQLGNCVFRECNSLTTIAWLSNHKRAEDWHDMFSGCPVKNIILGKSIHMLPLGEFFSSETAENLLITSPKIKGVILGFTGSHGSNIRQVDNIWYTGNKSDVERWKKEFFSLWNMDNVVANCDTYAFPALPEYIRGYDIISIIFNGQILFPDKAPYIKNDRTMVPMRTIFEAMGLTVDWNESTKTITAKGNGNTISLQIGNSVATVNGQTVKLDAAPEISIDRTMVPLRFVAESVGANVEWDGKTKKVDIYYGPATDVHKNSLQILESSYSFDTTYRYLTEIKDKDVSEEVAEKILLIANDPYKFITKHGSNAIEAILTDALLSEDALNYLETKSLYTYCNILTQNLSNVCEILLGRTDLGLEISNTINDIEFDRLFGKYAHICDLKDFTESLSEAQRDSKILTDKNKQLMNILTEKEKLLLKDMEINSNEHFELSASKIYSSLAEVLFDTLNKVATITALQSTYDYYYKGLILMADETESAEVKEAVLDIAKTMKASSEEAMVQVGLKGIESTVVNFAPDIIKQIGNKTVLAIKDTLDLAGNAADLALLYFETFDKSITQIEKETNLILLCEVREEISRTFSNYLTLSNQGQTYIGSSADAEKAFGVANKKIKTTDALNALSNVYVPILMQLSQLEVDLSNSQTNTIWKIIKGIVSNEDMQFYNGEYDKIHTNEMTLFKNVNLLY